MPEITTTLKPRSRDAWRRWLARNHLRADEIWLLLAKRHVPGAWLRYDEAIDEALCFGWIDGVVKRFDADFRALRLTPRRAGSVWSALNKRRVGRLVREGRMTPAGLAHVRAARASGEWARATRRRTGRAPADLRRALAAAPKAKAGFDALPPSHQRMWIAWVTDAKRPETRARRLARLVRDCAANRRLAGT